MEGPELVTLNCSSEIEDHLPNPAKRSGEVLHQNECTQDCPLKPSENTTEKAKEKKVMCSFVKAVNEKFNDECEESTEIHKLYLPRNKPVEVTESGTILLPRQLSMSGCDICVAGDCDVIKTMCPRVEELDLMANDMQSWDEVFDILQGTPQLTFLNLSQNRIPALPSELSDPCLPSLTRLVLNDTKVSWEVVLRLLQVFPQIEELHLSINDYSSFDIPESTPPYTSLQRLFFVGNKITDWHEINRIGTFFPKLEFFMLSETNVTHFAGSDRIQSSFPCLRILGLNRTCLNSWEEVEKLRNFPQLTDVRLRFIPFLENQSKDVLRHHTIAILPNITLLNQTPITDNEREDAERAYIRLYMDLEQKPSRFYELEKIHGKLDPLVKMSLQPKNTASVIVKVEELEDSDEVRKMNKGEEMDVDVRMTMKDLRKMLSNVANHPASKLQLYHVDIEGGSWMNRMLYPNMKLIGYKVSDGDEIIVVKLPLEENK